MHPIFLAHKLELLRWIATYSNYPYKNIKGAAPIAGAPVNVYGKMMTQIIAENFIKPFNPTELRQKLALVTTENV